MNGPGDRPDRARDRTPAWARFFELVRVWLPFVLFLAALLLTYYLLSGSSPR